MKRVFTLADFCTHYLQGHKDYTIQGEELEEYYDILKGLLEFGGNKLYLVTAPNFWMSSYMQEIYSTNSYILNDEVIKILENNKYIFLYSIGVSHLSDELRKGIQLRFYATNSIPKVSYKFELASFYKIKEINAKLAMLNNEKLDKVLNSLENK